MITVKKVTEFINLVNTEDRYTRDDWLDDSFVCFREEWVDLENRKIEGNYENRNIQSFRP